MTVHTEKGQAFFEMALGMFALALLVSIVCLVARYAARTLEIQNALRGKGGATSETFAADGVLDSALGVKTLKIDEPRGER